MSEQLKAAVEGATAPATSAPQTQETSAQPKVDQTGERLSFLAKKEQALRKQARELQAKQQEWERKQAEASKAPAPVNYKDLFMKNPAQALAQLGLSQEEFTQAMLSTSTESVEIQKLRAEIEELRTSQGKVTETFKTAQEKAYQDALKQVRRDVDKLVASTEEFETIKSMGHEQSVVDLIELTYKEDGILLTAEEAAKQVEDHLVEEAIKYAKLKKVQQKLTPAEAVTEKTEQKTEAPQGKVQTQVSSAPRTLTNTLSAQSASKATEKARMERAILAFQNKLS